MNTDTLSHIGITAIILILLVIIISLTILCLVCCLPRKQQVKVHLGRRLENSEYQRRGNNIFLEVKQDLPNQLIVRENKEIQTQAWKQVRFGEDTAQIQPSYNPLYRSLPAIAIDTDIYEDILLPPPYPTAPKLNVEEDFEVKKGEISIEEEPDKLPLVRPNVDHSSQIQGLEACSEVLIDRISRIERRLKQNNI